MTRQESINFTSTHLINLQGEVFELPVLALLAD